MAISHAANTPAKVPAELGRAKKEAKNKKKERELSNTSQPSRRPARKVPARWRTPARRGWEGELRLPGTCQGMGRHRKKRDGLRFNHGHGGGRRTSPCHTALTAKLCSSLSPHRHPSASAKPTCGSGKTRHGGSPTGPEAPGATIRGGLGHSAFHITQKTSRAKGEVTGIEAKGCFQTNAEGLWHVLVAGKLNAGSSRAG